MTPLIPSNTPEQNQFVSINDFKWCVNKGGGNRLYVGRKRIRYQPFQKTNHCLPVGAA